MSEQISLNEKMAKVMGWKKMHPADTEWYMQDAWTKLEEDVFFVLPDGSIRHANKNGYGTFDPSVNLSDAFLVVEHLRSEYEFELSTATNKAYHARFYNGDRGSGYILSSSACYAICHAVLIITDNKRFANPK